MVEAQEKKTGVRYDLVAKIRPDLNATRPISSYTELAQTLLDPTQPTLCTQGGFAPVGESEPLASLPLTLDDRFGLMSRAVASVYMNATDAFTRCQSRATNTHHCDGGKGAFGTGTLSKLAHKGTKTKRGRDREEGPRRVVRGHHSPEPTFCIHFVTSTADQSTYICAGGCRRGGSDGAGKQIRVSEATA